MICLSSTTEGNIRRSLTRPGRAYEPQARATQTSSLPRSVRSNTSLSGPGKTSSHSCREMGSSELAIGQTFSHYRLLDKLGEGGMGIVYLAEDTVLRRQVAIKFLSLERNRPMFHSRFLREAQAASKLNHSNIAAIYDYGKTEDERPFIVMELVRGQTLAELLKAGTLPIERSIEIIKKVLEALEEAHAHGIIHRDIKPSNISISDRGVVKVLDFGLAKSLLDEASETEGDARDLPTQTLTGVVLGTPLYVSPEQATGAPVDARSDVFSVGAVLYECIAKHPAFAAPSVVEIFAQVVSSVPPAAPSSYNPEATSEIDRIILKALSRSIADRYQSVREFLEDVQQLDPDPSRTSRRHRVLGSSLDALYRRIISHSHVRPPSVVAKNGSSSNWSHHKSRRAVTLVYLGVGMILIAVFIGVLTYRPVQPAAEPIDSIAVLPFVNESQDEKLDYIGEGLSDSLISNLSQLTALKVISRNSVARYKNQKIDPRAIGTDLNVKAFVSGTVKAVADEIEVAVELVDARDGSHVWGDHYKLKRSDTFSVGEEITQKISEKLRRIKKGEPNQMAAKNRPVNPAAHELYVKGKWYWNKRTNDDQKQAIICFAQAIEIDPDYALGYAGLADTYVINGWFQPRESYIRAKAAAERALQLDNTLGEAHATLGFIKAHYERDWVHAEEEFQHAISLKPSYATAYHWYGDLLLARGQFDQAMEKFKIAKELDPLSPMINISVGLVYYYGRQNDLAITYFRKMTDLFPNFFPAHYYLAWAYTVNGQYEEAIVSYQRALEISKGHSMVKAWLGYAYAKSGRADLARKVLRELQESESQKYVSPMRYAAIYIGLDEKDLAFKWLDTACDDLDLLVIYLNVNPLFDSLRGDARFEAVLRRLSLAS